MQYDLVARLNSIHETIAAAANGSGRRAEDIALVAVSKTVPVATIREAIVAGQYVFGENRVQEAASKVSALTDISCPLSWHLIGHLQTNKARQAIETFRLIESVDSFRLACRLDTLGRMLNRPVPVLLDVNIANESSKTGFGGEELDSVIADVLRLSYLRVHGLMTVAPLVSDGEDVRWVFRSLRERRDRLRDRWQLEELTELSMGMSNDFEVAIQEGATMVRIGRALFGERPT